MSVKNENGFFEKFIENKLNIKIIKIIGKGAFGSVYLVLLNNYKFIMKLFNNKLKKENKKQIKNEIKIILNCKSSYIIRGIKEKTLEYKNDTIQILLMENAKFQDLNIFFYNYFSTNLIRVFINTKQFDWINKFPEIGINYFSYQIVKSFEILNLNSIIHFDIKLGNLLLCENFKVKISDFSLSQFYKMNEKKIIYLPNGTYNYMGPEYYEKNPNIVSSFVEKVDYFGFGCILYYMIKKELLIKRIKDKNQKIIQSRKNDIINFINIGIRKIIDINIDSQLKDLIIKLINPKIEKRPSIIEISNNEWINKYKYNIQKIISINFEQDIKILTELIKFSPLNKLKKRRKKYKF
jgi:polo-like kinase 1